MSSPTFRGGANEMLLKDQQSPWEKVTVSWVVNNLNQAESWLKFLFRKSGYSYTEAVVQEVMDDVLQYFIDADDFDPEVGTKLQSYIYGGIHNGVMRYLSKLSEGYERFVSVEITDYMLGGKAHVDKYRDEKEIDRLCKSLECRRYTYGIDLFMLSYIALKLKDRARAYLIEIGIDSKDLKNAREMQKDEQYLGLLAVLQDSGADVVLRKYVYGANFLDRSIKHYMIRNLKEQY